MFGATEAAIEEEEGSSDKRVEQQDHTARKGSMSSSRGDQCCKRAIATASDVGEGRGITATEDVGGGMDYGGWEENEEGSSEGLAIAACVLSGGRGRRG
ncbi:hypothetical protein BHM03_00016635 [Ensete ventricosum]|nr:hypothetical protein BHM03_00016635 [Ensete ventricosum]